MKNYISDKHRLLAQWFPVKESLHKTTHPLPFKEGEVWWCNLGENVGVEINGKHEKFTRPILVLRKFNKYSFMGGPTYFSTPQRHLVRIFIF